MSTGIPALEAMKARLRWLEARQGVLAGNVANADTPRFVPKDLAPMTGSSTGHPALALARTAGQHLGGGGAGSGAGSVAGARFETRPRGNAVSLEEEMLKISETQMEHQTLAGLYQRSLMSLRTAIGRKG